MMSFSGSRCPKSPYHLAFWNICWHDDV